MNTDELEWALMKAERRVLGIQTMLHRWATDDSHRRFDDLFNLVADPAFLLVAWDRVRGNRGARTAGVDGKTARSIEAGQGVETPYGFRSNRRAHDAIAETRYLASHGYEWVVEGDITACFDEISHPALMDRVRNRIGDKRVLSLVKAFLKSGIPVPGRCVHGHTHRDPAGWDPFASAGQHRTLGSGRAHRPGTRRTKQHLRGTAQETSQLPAGPVRGRLPRARLRTP